MEFIRTIETTKETFFIKEEDGLQYLYDEAGNCYNIDFGMKVITANDVKHLKYMFETSAKSKFEQSMNELKYETFQNEQIPRDELDKFLNQVMESYDRNSEESKSVFNEITALLDKFDYNGDVMEIKMFRQQYAEFFTAIIVGTSNKLKSLKEFGIDLGDLKEAISKDKTIKMLERHLESKYSRKKPTE